MNSSDLFKYYRSTSVRDFEYTVKKGDTLYKIAKHFNVPLSELLAINKLEKNIIYPNQSIVIPSNSGDGSVYFEEYITEPNDTLAIISEKIKVPIELLTKYNDVNNLVLAENQVVQVPKQYNKYVVQEGDTYEMILRKFFMTPEELIYANRYQWLRPGSTINVK